ncbi:hypothetical protein B0H34DRAFT_783564 [Crassisporium funariophilum]|nr:hypothetical protein B0H34DRAFT_783564 [Crassisporium funariophilum]
MPHGPGQLPHILNILKHERLDNFCQELQVSPYTFNRLVEHLMQMPVEDQVAIALYCFGHFGNAAGLNKVAKWSGYAKGTVHLATQRVMTAILRGDFMDKAVSLPTEEEKEAAKKWIEDHSCKGWRDRWYRPFWYGESYFDRKSNYSLNIQVHDQ